MGGVADGDAIDTSAVGTYTFTVIGTDLAGNTTTVEISYNVQFQFCLLYDPDNEQPATGTVPIKVAVCDSNDNVIKNPQHTLTALVVVDLDDNIAFIPGPNDTGKANLGFESRVQGGGKSYIYNLNVDELFLPDGTLTDLPGGHYALGFVVDAVFLPDPDPYTGAPVPADPEEIVYLVDFRLKD